MGEATGAGPSGPALSIIIVTWNCRDLIGACLQAIQDSRVGAAFEVIVVDNASSDGTADRVAADFPSVRLIRNTGNAGFAKANNQGFQIARGGNLLLLNPDAFPKTKDTLAHLLGFLQQHAAYDGVGCQLIFPDGRHQVGDAGYRPTLANIAAYALGLTQIFPGLGGVFLARPPETEVIDVDWICGACFLVRADAVTRFGGMNERFQLYAEDVEWGCRIRDGGGRIGYLPGEQVIHLQGGTQGLNEARAPTRWLDSLASLYALQNGGRRWSAFKALLVTGFLLRAAAYRAASVLPGRSGLAGKARLMSAFARHTKQLRRSPAAPELLTNRR